MNRIHPGKDLAQSLRRLHVDDFQRRHTTALAPGGLVLDLGGTKLGKRGSFDVSRCPVRLVTANLVSHKGTDVVCDAARLPFPAGRYDAVVCAEVLEHVPDVIQVLGEIRRVLRPNGLVVITAPFLAPIHRDPQDFSRHTDEWWRFALTSCGFKDVAIERQGLFWSVLADFARGFVLSRCERPARLLGPVRAVLRSAVVAARSHAVRWDSAPGADQDAFLSRHTTGFGIVARRS